MAVNTTSLVNGGRGNAYERPGERARSASGASGNETRNLNPDSFDPRGRDQIPPVQVNPDAYDPRGRDQIPGLNLNTNAANAFTVGYGAGQVDPRLARAVADQTTQTPRPSTVQATNAAPAGGATPSSTARQNTTFTTLSPRPYFRIDPLDNRYDFLTGQKVNTYNSATIAAGLQPQSNTNIPTGGGAGGNNTGGTGGSSDQVFYNEFGDSYTAADRERVEQLRSFNAELGGGAASAQLTAGERAYAISQGYIGSTTTTTAADPNQTGPQ